MKAQLPGSIDKFFPDSPWDLLLHPKHKPHWATYLRQRDSLSVSRPLPSISCSSYLLCPLLPFTPFARLAPALPSRSQCVGPLFWKTLLSSPFSYGLGISVFPQRPVLTAFQAGTTLTVHVYLQAFLTWVLSEIPEVRDRILFVLYHITPK